MRTISLALLGVSFAGCSLIATFHPGGPGDADADVDTDADADAEVETDTGANADADLDVDSGVDGALDAEPDTDSTVDADRDVDACPTSCADSLDCTDDACVGGVCTHGVQPGHCLIDGHCYLEGDRRVGASCQVCRASSSAAAWTPVTGEPCFDGLSCTLDETCSDGVCVGTPTCAEDALWCTNAICSPDPVGCHQHITDYNCLIADVCYANGELNPANECEECNAYWYSDREHWLPAVGRRCNDDTGECDVTGACVPDS